MKRRSFVQKSVFGATAVVVTTGLISVGNAGVTTDSGGFKHCENWITYEDYTDANGNLTGEKRCRFTPGGKWSDCKFADTVP
jgi:hypothetical protein